MFIAFKVVYGFSLLRCYGLLSDFWITCIDLKDFKHVLSVACTQCVFPVLRNILGVMPGSCAGWVGEEGSSCVRG